MTMTKRRNRKERAHDDSRAGQNHSYRVGFGNRNVFLKCTLYTVGTGAHNPPYISC
jgi:hypothetical protein